MANEMKVMCAHDEVVHIDKLIPNPKNPNKHTKEQITLLAKIMNHQGFRNPVVVSNRSGFIIKGHARVESAKLNKWEKVPVDYQDYDTEADEYADMVADNKIAELAETDLSQVMKDALEIGPFDPDLLGIPDFKFEPDLDRDKEAIEDSVPEVNEAICKLGDIWQLGEHRLMCGDSTSKEQVDKLLNGEKADMIFTDPPYGMKAVSSSGVLSANYKTDILGDDSPDLAKRAFQLASDMAPKQVWWGANYYASVIRDASCWLVWDKNNGGSDQTDCELAWTNLPGVVRQFTQASEKTNRVHPTQKPISLIEWCLDKYEAGNILDLFGGSGSTMIACEKTKRKCYMMELDPHYCDVIIKRWEDYTGKKAKLCQSPQDTLPKTKLKKSK